MGVSVPTQTPRILVVEDNPDNLLTVQAILRRNYTLLTASDGEAGLQQAFDVHPDLILLDMFLPKLDGFQVVKQLKQYERTKTIPVIALTAHAMKGDREGVIAAGCDDYLSKPLDPEELLACVQKWLAG